MKIITEERNKKKYHLIGDVKIACSGTGCLICEQQDIDEKFKEWEETVPFPIPPKGKRYKKRRIQRNRGKTIQEICYSCKKIPCYICSRGACPEWMKENARKGQEEGCSSWEKGNRCTSFFCEKELIKTNWHNFRG